MSPRRFFQACARLGLGRRTALALLLLDLAIVLTEGIGIGMILPIVNFFDAGGDLEALAAGSPLWSTIVSVYTGLGLPVTLPSLLITSMVFLGISIGFVYGRTIYAGHARYTLIRTIRNRAFLQYLGVRLSFSENDELGSAVNDLTIEAERGSSCVFQVLSFVGALLLILAYFGLAFAVSAPMTLLVIPIVIVAVVAVHGMIRRSREAGEKVTESNQLLGRFLVERLRSLRFIRLAGTERAERTAMEQLTQSQFSRYLLILTLGARVAASIEVLGVVAILGFLYLGFSTFNLSLGEIGLFLAAMLRLMPRVKELMRTRQALMSFVGSLDALEARFDAMTSAREERSGSRSFTGLQSAIEFLGVGFDYGREGAPALRDVTLTIPAGKMIALVGPSGAGKSTLIDLLPRLREPTSGEIRFDDIPLRDFDLTQLRAGFAYAPQTPQVFNATAAEHIAYGRPDATAEEIIRAAKLAGAHEFIEKLPEGYETPVGENGIRLSGGQRQRLDLARSLVGGTPIVILDEPTSNLDADAEDAFRRALLRICSETDVTMIVVGHRLSTVAIADQIVVLEDGRVIDVGTHQEILGHDGWYSQAFAKQQAPVRTAQAALTA